MKPVDLILDAPGTETAWTPGGHLLLTLGIIAICILIFLFGIFIAQADAIFNPVWATPFFAIAAILFVAAPYLSKLIYPVEKPQSVDELLTNEEKIQVWANNTYAITLSEKDAKILYDGKLDYDEQTLRTDRSTGAIVDYYNTETMVNLVKNDGVWKLFSNDTALPDTETRAK